MKRIQSVWLAVFIALALAGLLTTHSSALSISTSALSFPNVFLNGYDQSILGSTSAWQVDASGEAGGWNATISATDFTNGVGGVIYVSNLEARLADSSIVLVSGDPILPTSTQTTFAALSGVGLKFVSAASGTSDGIYDLTPEIRLTVPAETYIGNYTSTLTITVSVGP
ncbi:MAG: hypothetical protein HN390_07400 [Anaerolineae bacterium]|jgi:hypothetical protein|nr:hypothetical protein [Anaerolineae bacterium]MBT7189569.1 hypothetical protein [Anaerolineae bacterium]MBT7992094.1 hypothetical protein [Anaerolineae bacterium]